MLKVGMMSIGFPNFRYDLAQNILAATIEWIKDKDDVQLICVDQVLIEEEKIEQGFKTIKKEDPDLFILQLGTYSYGSALMMYLDIFKDTHILLWSFREPMVPDYPGLPLNSLCALNMYTSFLHRMELADFSYLYGNLEEEKAQEKINALIKAASIKKKLKKSRFCVIGGRVPGFYLSNVDELRFKKAVGPEVVHLSIANLIHKAEAITNERVSVEVVKKRERTPCITACDEALNKTARVYLALKDYAEENGIDGYAIKCWPDFQDIYSLAVCGVVSQLNDEGLLTSCEGDVTGLTTMMIQQELTDEPVFLTDLVNVTEEGTVKLWHCGGAATRLAADTESVCLAEHPTIKQGIGIGVNMDIHPGQLVISKLSEGDPYRLLICEGECIEPDRQLTGNQGDIRLKGSVEDLLDCVVKNGIEHHYSIAFGCDAKVLRELSHLCQFELLEV